MKKGRGGGGGGGYRPHLVDGRREREAERLGRDGFARLEARRAEREVHLDLVAVVAVRPSAFVEQRT